MTESKSPPLGVLFTLKLLCTVNSTGLARHDGAQEQRALEGAHGDAAVGLPRDEDVRR